MVSFSNPRIVLNPLSTACGTRTVGPRWDCRRRQGAAEQEAPDARYVKLAQSERLDTLAVADVWRLLHDANQGAATIHRIVFGPAKATIHVAFGDGRTSASANNMTSIDLSPWLVPR